MKFWTTQGGAIGTAHIDRNGKMVDFRPFSRINVDEREDEENVVLYPFKGQEGIVDPLSIRIIRFEVMDAEDHSSNETTIWQRKKFFAEWEGIEVSFMGLDQPKWRSKEIMERTLREQKKERAEILKVEAQKEDFLSNIPLGEEFIAQISGRKISKIRVGKVELAEIVSNFLEMKLQERFSIPSRVGIDDLLISNEIYERSRNVFNELKENIFAYDDKRRETRKQEWLAKKTKKE